jgi:50S ribosomal protein L16 3-hydroxylase
LLIRQAFPQFRSPVTREALFALAARDDVESRRVTAFGGRWALAHGPFARSSLPVHRKRWTVLVQGVDLHLPAAHALLQRFRFVSDARLDDLMASYATDGGGVGPHVDSYDVFLLQAQGRRRWRIGRQRDRALVPGLPLQILANFRPTAEWLLEPGDMLYLPPGVVHEGVALGECITLSIGYRSPAWQELVEPCFLQRAALARLPGRYADAGARPVRRPGRLPAAMIEQAWQRLSRLRPKRSDAVDTLLAQLTEP